MVPKIYWILFWTWKQLISLDSNYSFALFTFVQLFYAKNCSSMRVFFFCVPHWRIWIENWVGKIGKRFKKNVPFYLNQSECTLSNTQRMCCLMNQTVKYIIFEWYTEHLSKNSFATWNKSQPPFVFVVFVAVAVAAIRHCKWNGLHFKWKRERENMVLKVGDTHTGMELKSKRKQKKWRKYLFQEKMFHKRFCHREKKMSPKIIQKGNIQNGTKETDALLRNKKFKRKTLHSALDTLCTCVSKLCKTIYRKKAFQPLS